MPSEQQVKAWIAESLERSPCGHTLDQVFQDVNEGHAGLIVGEQSAAVVQPLIGMRVWHAGGNMEDLIAQMKIASEVWKQRGIERLTIENTRKGWAKALRPYGFEQFSGLELYL